MAGGLEYKGYWLDAHSGQVPAQLLDILVKWLPALPNLRALVFEMLPTFISRAGLDVVRKQIEQLRALWESRGSVPKAALPLQRVKRESVPPSGTVTPTLWEDTLGALVVGRTVESKLGNELAADPGVGVLQNLVRDQRAGTIVSTLKLSSRFLNLYGGEAFLRGLLNEFWAQNPPRLFASTEALEFVAFLERQVTHIPHFEEVLAYERAVMESILSGEVRYVAFTCEPLALLRALGEGHLPAAIQEGDFEVECHLRCRLPRFRSTRELS